MTCYGFWVEMKYKKTEFCWIHLPYLLRMELLIFINSTSPRIFTRLGLHIGSGASHYMEANIGASIVGDAVAIKMYWWFGAPALRQFLGFFFKAYSYFVCACQFIILLDIKFSRTFAPRIEYSNTSTDKIRSGSWNRWFYHLQAIKIRIHGIWIILGNKNVQRSIYYELWFFQFNVRHSSMKSTFNAKYYEYLSIRWILSCNSQSLLQLYYTAMQY